MKGNTCEVLMGRKIATFTIKKCIAVTQEMKNRTAI